MQLATIFYILLLISASGLCISLIFYLNRITKSIREIQTDIKELTLQVKPLIASTTNLSEKLNYISEQAKQPISIATGIVEDVKDRVDDILAFEDKIRSGVEGPILTFFSNLSGLLNGVNAFWKTYKRKQY